eukprot:9476254-Pyramimonas_sp.AAC.1
MIPPVAMDASMNSRIIKNTPTYDTGTPHIGDKDTRRFIPPKLVINDGARSIPYLDCRHKHRLARILQPRVGVADVAVL